MSKFVAVFGTQGSVHYRHSWHDTTEAAHAWLQRAQDHLSETDRAAWPQPTRVVSCEDPEAKNFARPVGRPPKSDRRSERVEFRCTSDELLAYAEAAFGTNGAEGVLSDWIRTTLNKAAGLS